MRSEIVRTTIRGTTIRVVVNDLRVIHVVG
jgi:hypothetical protein